MSTIQRPTTIYAESTPNPASMKFVANRLLVHDGIAVQYLNISETKGAPLAEKLFRFPFVQGVFISGNFITITKSGAIAWEDITLEIREFLKNYISEGNAILTEIPETASAGSPPAAISDHAIPANETEGKIIEILDQYIRPAVEQDGGLITFKSFKEGIVTVALQGACSGCPSSTLTLKAGIEGLLKRMIPEVKEVVSEAV